MIVESGKFNYANGKFPSMADPEPAYHGLKFYENFGDFAFTTKARAVALRDFGPTLSPMNAWLTITGIETLHLRMERHVANAQQVAEFLAGQPFPRTRQTLFAERAGFGLHLWREGRF